jgi:NADP-dependent 3-hydroxy acid dehydrogenase YdfG
MGVRITRAVVTGAPSSIGRAFARRLGIDGASAVLAGPDRARLQAVADEISASGSGAGLAVAGPAGEAPLRAVGRRLADAEPGLLVNAAGVAHFGQFAKARSRPVRASCVSQHPRRDAADASASGHDRARPRCHHQRDIADGV